MKHAARALAVACALSAGAAAQFDGPARVAQALAQAARRADPLDGVAAHKNVLRHYFDQDVGAAQVAPVKAALSSFLGVSREALSIRRPPGRWPYEGGPAFGADGAIRVDISAPDVLKEDRIVGLKLSPRTLRLEPYVWSDLDDPDGWELRRRVFAELWALLKKTATAGTVVQEAGATGDGDLVLIIDNRSGAEPVFSAVVHPKALRIQGRRVVGLDDAGWILLPRPAPQEPTFSNGTRTLRVSRPVPHVRWTLNGKPVKDLL